MAVIFETSLVLLLTLVAYIVVFFKLKFKYWRRKQVAYIQPRFPFGTTENPFRKTRTNALELQEHYRHFKSQGLKYGGIYTFFKPALLLVDPDIVRHVMLKDFQHFTDRGTFFNEKADPLGANLLTLRGQEWRFMRAKLTPTFTSGKMKGMFSTLVACGNPLHFSLTKFCDTNEPIEIKDILSRYTTDVIGSCAFGLECNSFKEPEGDFRRYGRMVFAPFSNYQFVKLLFANICPSFAKRMRLLISNSEPKVFFLNIVQETINFRRQNKVSRNDFMQLLMELMDEDGCNGLNIKQVAAQAFVFFLAGFETSSTTMTFCLYELALNQEIQEKLRNEINSVLQRYKGEITYEAIMEMTYLDSVINETLRKYPPAPVVGRVCTLDYQIEETDITIEKGTSVTIPIYALHHDPDYFPLPETFNPDRFSDENKSSIKPLTYIPFGEGPRNCIGLRFGLLQTKVGLVMLLRNFKYLLNSKTKFPLQFSVRSIILNVDGGVWLDVKSI